MRLKAVIKRKGLNVSLCCWNTCGRLNRALLLIYFYKFLTIASEPKVERPWRRVIYQGFFFSCWCGAVHLRGPPACRLFLRRGLRFVQSVPRPAFCASLANTRVGPSGTDFELLTSTDVRKTCRSTATLILALLGTTGRWLTGSPCAGLFSGPGPARQGAL